MRTTAADAPSGGVPTPFVSVIVPTLNSARTLAACLRAIRAQAYPRACLEIVLADAGSTDGTLEIARQQAVDRIVANPLRTGEAGKAAAIAAARGAILALIDSDNLLPDDGWLRRMVAPFADPRIFASEPLAYLRRPEDSSLNRYFALLGMNDPLCLFLGNYDRLCAVTGRWTGLELPVERRDGYLRVRLAAGGPLPTIGANGCLVRRAALEGVAWSPYYFDIDVIQQAVANGWTEVAKVDGGIVHLYADTLADFARKQRRRIRDYLHFAGTRQRTYAWRGGWGVVRFCLATVLTLPLLAQAVRGCARQPDTAWRWHVPVCWATLWCYGLAVARARLGGRRDPASREGWQRSG